MKFLSSYSTYTRSQYRHKLNQMGISSMKSSLLACNKHEFAVQFGFCAARTLGFCVNSTDAVKIIHDLHPGFFLFCYSFEKQWCYDLHSTEKCV